MRKLTVLLVDNSEMFRQGLMNLLNSEPDIEVVASTVSQAIEAATAHKPDVILLDIEQSGVEAISRIKQILPQIPIIILTHSKSSTDFFSAIRAGATGYVFKESSLKNLVKTLALVVEEKFVIAPPMAKIAACALGCLDELRHLAEAECVNLLSERERVVLILMAHGTTNRQIGSILFTSENTVKMHVRSIMRKLHARDRLEARVCAIEIGLLCKEADTLEAEGKDSTDSFRRETPCELP